MTNNKNETPLDLVKFRIYDSILLINPSCLNDITMLTMLTRKYYFESFPKLEKIMIENGCMSNFSLIDMLISMASENLEKITSDEYYKEEAIKMTELMKTFESLSKKLKTKSDLLNMCIEDQSEINKIKVQEHIKSMKEQNEPRVVYLQNLIYKLKKLPSDEVNSFDDLIKLLS